MKNPNTSNELKSALEKLGAREYEVIALTMLPDRGLAALQYALEKGVDRPIPYAIKLFDSDTWNPAGEVSRRATNQSVTTECGTCGGNRFVLVGTRPVAASQWQREHGLEVPEGAAEQEYAPCPDCNAHVDASFWRPDGTRFVSMDAAHTRERMERQAVAGAAGAGEVPEWVRIWHWARNARKPRNMRPFPQQEGHATHLMTMEEYEALREEWVQAGSPGFNLGSMVEVNS